jgi:hypothetical protein
MCEGVFPTYSEPRYVLNGNEWSVLCSAFFTTGERVMVTHTVGGWLGTEIDLDTMAAKAFPGRKSNSECPAHSQVEPPPFSCF